MLCRLACAAFAVLLFAPAAPADDFRSTYGTGEKVCGDLSLAAVTGQSPWLAMGVGGAVEYYNTPDEAKANVGFFASPWVWGVMLAVVVLVGCKDTLLTLFSQLKLPLDALAEAAHAAGGVVALTYLAVAAFDPPADHVPTAFDHLRSVLLWLLLAVVHAAVWVVFNTVEVAILLNPIPFVDTALKFLRTLFVAAVGGATALHPVFGFVLALPVILVCFALVPYALRFAVAGWVCSADLLKRLVGIRPAADGPVRAFASLGFKGVPVGVYGTVDRGPAGVSFTYRKWFLLPRRVALPWERAAVAGGVLPRLVLLGTDGVTLLRFPPRYAGKEADLALTLGLGDVLRRSPRDTIVGWWRRLKAYFSKKQPDTGEPA